MDIALFFIGLFLVSYWLYSGSIFKEIKTYKWLIISLFIIKLTGAIALWNFYEKTDDRINSDIFKYYDDGLVVKQAVMDNPSLFFKLFFQSSSEDIEYKKIAFKCGNWETVKNAHNFMGNRLMIRCNAMLSFIFGSNYFLHLLTFTLLGFLGIIYIVKSINSRDIKLNSLALCVLTLSPSLLIWSSGILKETILIFFIGLLCLHIRKLQLKPKNYISIIISIICYVMIWVIRSSLGYCLVVALLFGLTYIFLSRRTLYPATISLITLCISGTLFLNFNSINEKQIIGERRMEFLELSEIYDAGSTYEVPVLISASEMIYKLPLAAYNTMFRPGIFDIKKSSFIPFVLESLFLLTLIFAVILFGRIEGLHQKTLIYSIIILILSMSIIIGLTVPIFGASVRYRAPLVLLSYAIFIFIFAQSIFKRKPSIITKINP